jgi:hypothetical protein
VSRHAPSLLLLFLSTPLSGVASQSTSASPSVIIIPTAGRLDFGEYFTGPAGVTFSNQTATGYGGELSVRVWKGVSVLGTVLHASSNWSFDEIPLLGRVTVEGASLWFYDIGVRGQTRLASSSPLSAFAQAGAGAIHYSVNNPLFSGSAFNVTFSGGVGLIANLAERVSLQGLLKDYYASFRSVDDAAAYGIEGQRAHTLALLFGLGIGL